MCAARKLGAIWRSAAWNQRRVRRQLLMIAWRYLRLEAGRTPAIPSLLMLFASLYALLRLLLEVSGAKTRSSPLEQSRGDLAGPR